MGQRLKVLELVSSIHGSLSYGNKLLR